MDGLAILDLQVLLVAKRGRVRAIGHGTSYPISREAALDVARDAGSTERPAADGQEPNAIMPGDSVSVIADDDRGEPVTGVMLEGCARGRLLVDFQTSGRKTKFDAVVRTSTVVLRAKGKDCPA